MRFSNEHVAIAPMRDCLGDRKRRTFANVVDVRLERKTKTPDPGTQHALGAEFDREGTYFFKNGTRLGVVDFPRGADQPSLLWCRVNDKPRIDCDAVSTDAGPRLQDVHPRMTIGKPHQFPHIDPK